MTASAALRTPPLDRLVRTELRFAGRRWQAYRTCGITGLVLAVALALALVAHTGLSPLLFAAVIVSAVATFVGLVSITRLLAGAELIVNYHCEIAVMVTTALLLRLLGRPVLPYLDLTILGVGTFVACGRVGCFLVGCCHGRAQRWGVCYGHEHASAGFPGWLVGVRLAPVQLLESAWVFSIVAVDVALLLLGARPGVAFVWHASAYAAGRFCCELLRGDAGRRYFGSFSEAQWTSLAVLAAVTLLGLAGALPALAWQPAATLGLAAVMAALSAAGGGRRLFRPQHVQQLAALLDHARARASAAGELHVGETSLGLRVSASKLLEAPSTESGGVEIVAFSCPGAALSHRRARRLAALIHQLLRAGTGAHLLAGARGVYHLVLPAQRSSAHAL